MKTITDSFFSESFLNTIAELNKLQLTASAMAIKSAWPTISNRSLEGISAALKESAAVSKRFSELTIQTKALTSWVNTISAVQADVISNAVATVLPQIDLTMCSVLKDAAAMATVAKADWSWIAELPVQGEEDEGDLGVEELVTPEVRAQITEDVVQALSDPGQVETVSRSKYDKWAKDHPFLATVFMQVLISLLVECIMCGLGFGFNLATALVTKDARVYEEPSAKGSVVVNIAIEQNVTIVGAVPYFYEIEVPNPETGEVVTGYVYKGNLAIQEEEDSTSVEDEKTVPAAPAETTSDSLEAAPSSTE